MRALIAVALTVTAGLILQALQAVPSSAPLVVVVDADSVAADPVDAARLRRLLLEHIDPSASASVFTLTSDRLEQVPSAEVAATLRTVFTATPPTYSGVTVSFAEALEVLRGNEFARDTVIARECPAAPEQCAGRVHAAVDAEVKRAEAISAGKLRRLAANAGAWRHAQVVLLTSGWPTRDDGRVGLDRALRDLRANGPALTVVRVPPRSPYRGLVRDASESLAAQLPAGFVILQTDVDVGGVAARLGVRVEAPRPDVAPPPIAALPDMPPTTPALPSSPTPVEPTSAADELSGPRRREASSPVPPLDATLRKAVAYVARFEQAFTEVVWHERYEQIVRVARRTAASGSSILAIADRRTLESDLFFAWLPNDATWISVRDVTSVDGSVRPSSSRRFSALAARGNVSVLELRDLAKDNGRFNIGNILRTFSEPTLPLLFLDERYRGRATFVRKGPVRLGTQQLTTYGFEELGRPTVIQQEGHELPLRGTIDIDDASGEIWRSTLELAGTRDGLAGRMLVNYRRHVAFDVLVPNEMRERYVRGELEQVDTTAIYSDFRRFQTTGRLILPGS